VPKSEIVHTAGQEIEASLRDWLLKHFKLSEVSKLEQAGGVVSVTIKFTKPERLNKDSSKSIQIDEHFLKRLEEIKSSTTELQNNLDELTEKQLRQICQLISLPVRSSARTAEIKAELIRFLQDEDIWNRISRRGE